MKILKTALLDCGSVGISELKIIVVWTLNKIERVNSFKCSENPSIFKHFGIILLSRSIFSLYTISTMRYPTTIRNVFGPNFSFQLHNSIAKFSCKYHAINISIC